MVTKEVHLLSPLLQFQLSSVVSVPGLSQGPWEIADSTERREEARRMKRGTSILVIEGCPALWGLSTHLLYRWREEENRLSPGSNSHLLLVPPGISCGRM